MSRRTLFILVLIGVGGLILLADALIETDKEAIERLMEDCRAAVLAGDSGKVVATLDPDATAGGFMGSGPLTPRVRHFLDRVEGRLQGLHLSRDKLEVDGDEARGRWTLKVTFSEKDPVRPVLLSVRVRYRRAPEGWRIRHAEAGTWQP